MGGWVGGWVGGFCGAGGCVRVAGMRGVRVADMRAGRQVGKPVVSGVGTDISRVGQRCVCACVCVCVKTGPRLRR